MASFRGWPDSALAFYRDLELDNTRAFWLAHKETYERDVKAPFEALSDLVAEEFGPLRVFRPQPGRALQQGQVALQDPVLRGDRRRGR